jgi:hypothetical protein
MTAGFENPFIASIGEIKPITIKIPNTERAVTSIGRVSVTNNAKAITIISNTMAISKVILIK